MNIESGEVKILLFSLFFYQKLLIIKSYYYELHGRFKRDTFSKVIR